MFFLQQHLLAADVTGKDILEVGSFDVNGSPRTVVCPRLPKSYVGVDMQPGAGVDLICDGAKVHEKFGESAFDVVICCEMLEHVKDWKAVVSSMKRVLKIGGVLIVTTRGPGFFYHAYPDDFWRFTLDHARAIFADMTIEALEADVPETPGILLRARKPAGFVEKDLSNIEVIPMPQPAKWQPQ
jgi:SAM-dependent methyltransferase